MKAGWWKTASLGLGLFALNLLFVGKLAGIEYLDEMGSIEGTYIAVARWIANNWGDLTWFPLWYGGIPFENSYSPLLPLVTAAVSAALGATPALSYHAVTAAAYALGPVTLYSLAARISRSSLCGAAAGLLYTLTSFSTVLMPNLRQETGGLWGLRRLLVLVRYGEGPHVMGLMLLPAAVLLLVTAFEKRRPAWWLAGALGCSLVMLTNWLATAALLLAVMAWLLARTKAAGWRDWFRAAGVMLLGYFLACPGIPPSVIRTIARNERYVSGELSPLWIRAALAASGAIAVALLMRLLERWRVPLGVRFAAALLLMLGGAPLASSWFGLSLVPQPQRYQLELEMAAALLLALLGQWAAKRISRRSALIAGGVLLAACVYPAVRLHKQSAALIRPIDIRKTSEYRMANWFESNVAGQRVLAPGSAGFWLNVFTDVEQMAGGFDQGVSNPLWTHVYYQVLSGENAGEDEGRVAGLWLKAFGVGAVAVTGPGSSEWYKPFRNPAKFDGHLPEIRRDGDYVIYRAGGGSTGLAHVMRKEDLPAREPRHGLDVAPLERYAAALEDSSLPAARMRWKNRHRAEISANLREGEVLSVQMSHDEGWRAVVSGSSCNVLRDHIGQIVIEPGCVGECTVELIYSRGLEAQLTRGLSIACWGGMTAWVLLSALRRRRFTNLQ